MFSSSTFAFKSATQLLSLISCQVYCLILVVQRQQPDLLFRKKTVINYTRSAALSFAPPMILPSKLTDTTCSRNQVAGFWVSGKAFLEFPESVIIKILLAMPAESRSFDELEKVRFYPIPRFLDRILIESIPMVGIDGNGKITQ